MPGNFPELNFPVFEHKIKIENNQNYIWEPIRKMWIILTPEEWVRQNLIRYLTKELKYPMGLMQTECQIRVGKVNKRFDLVVMDKTLHPWLICECKAPKIKIDAAVMQQASHYNSKLKCPFLAITNGLMHYCFEINFKEGSYKNVGDFPVYPEK